MMLSMSTTPQITLLYDGLCPICSREMKFMRKRDRRAQLGFEDITAPGFSAERYGLTENDVVARMHGVLPDGRVVAGMEAFRIAYRALGMGWLVAPTGWPLLRPLFDLFYRTFAKYRPRLSKFTGGCTTDRCTPR
jgi:predicted DCC family thiol-disulfide oxidoreductase YuxK